MKQDYQKKQNLKYLPTEEELKKGLNLDNYVKNEDNKIKQYKC